MLYVIFDVIKEGRVSGAGQGNEKNSNDKIMTKDSLETKKLDKHYLPAPGL